MLISDPIARAERAQAKRDAVLRFLAGEVWTSAPILGQVAGVAARPAVHRLLVAMERDSLIRRSTAPILAGQGISLWGITPHGRALCPEADPTGPTFEPSRISIQAVPHHLALQALRRQAEAAGWTDWMRGERLGQAVAIRPDAIAKTPAGVQVAVECELTIKTVRRYQSVLAEHLRAIVAGRWVGVYYTSPPSVARGLARMFAAIKTLPGGVPFDDTRRSRFKIVTNTSFPE